MGEKAFAWCGNAVEWFVKNNHWKEVINIVFAATEEDMHWSSLAMNSKHFQAVHVNFDSLPIYLKLEYFLPFNIFFFKDVR